MGVLFIMKGVRREVRIKS